MKKAVYILIICSFYFLSYGQYGSSIQLSKDTIGVGEVLSASLNIFKPEGQNLVGIDLNPVYTPQTLLNMVATTDSLGAYPEPDMEIHNLGDWQAFADSKQINSDKLNWINDAAGKKDFVTNEVQYIFWDPGVYQLSGVDLLVQDSASMNYILPMKGSMVFVMPPESLMDTTVQQQEIRPIKTIIKEDKNWRDFIWLYILVGLLLLCIVALYLFKRFYKPQSKSQIPVAQKMELSPYHQAIENLDLLKQEKLWQNGKIKDYQSKLTTIIRKYISRRYQVPAMENTSDEIIRALKTKKFDPKLNSQLTEILTIADLVKFAKADPPEDIHERFLDQAYHLVNATNKQIIKEEEE